MAQGKAANIDWKLVDKQIHNGKSKEAIAKDLQLHVVTFRKLFRERSEINETPPILAEQQAIENFKKNRANVFANIQRTCTDILLQDDCAKLKTASAAQLAIVSGTFYDKERLETGQSTANVQTLTMILEAISKDNTPEFK
jgi:hypothetical protein